MAKARVEQAGVSAYQLDGRQGWSDIRAMEDGNAIASEEKFGCEVVRYEVQPNPKGWEITCIVEMADPGTARKAEWNGFMTVKRRHASIYGESKMAMKTSTGYTVYVRWMIWNNQLPSDRYNQPSA